MSDIAGFVTVAALAALSIALVFFTPAVVRLYAQSNIWMSKRTGGLSDAWNVWFAEMMTGMKFRDMNEAASKNPRAVPYYIWLFRVLGVSSSVVALVVLVEVT